MNDALEREETLRKIAAEEKAKYLKAMEEVQEARNLLAKEAYEKKLAEVDALKESIEKQKIVDALFSSDRRYRRYTRDEIEAATDMFSVSNVIGEGGYGKVYKCSLHHTPVAVKVLRPDAIEKKQGFLKEEFLKEVILACNPFHFSVTMFLNSIDLFGLSTIMVTLLKFCFRNSEAYKNSLCSGLSLTNLKSKALNNIMNVIGSSQIVI